MRDTKVKLPRPHKNAVWKLPDTLGWEHASISVLMDIRDELRELKAGKKKRKNALAADRGTALKKILRELGGYSPSLSGYPAPVSNAVQIARRALGMPS